MAVVVGSRIIKEPAGGLQNILAGAGDLFKAIGTQRLEAQEREKDEVFLKTLLPQPQPGPLRPGDQPLADIPAAVSGSRNRFNAIMERAIEARSPERRKFFLDLAKTQGATIPAREKEPLQNAIFKTPEGNVQEVKATLSQIQGNENLELVGATDPNLRVVTDPITKQSRTVDITTLPRLGADGTPLQTAGTIPQSQGLVPTADEKEAFLSTEDILRSTGMTSNTFAFLGNVAGSIIRGEQFPKTQTARENVRLVNSRIRQIASNSDRYNVFEQKLIGDALVDTKAFFTDPAGALRKYKQIQDFVGKDNLQIEQQLLNQNLPAKKRIELESKKVDNAAILSLLPSQVEFNEALRIEPGKTFADVTLQDVQGTSVEELKRGLAQFSDAEVRQFPPEVRNAIRLKLKQGK